jgi:hypothetical protein
MREKTSVFDLSTVRNAGPRLALLVCMSNTKNKKQLTITTSRGLGRYAARITVGQGPALHSAMNKALALFPELDQESFVEGWADERNEMAKAAH